MAISLVLPAADFWPDRAIVILVVLILTRTLAQGCLSQAAAGCKEGRWLLGCPRFAGAAAQLSLAYSYSQARSQAQSQSQSHSDLQAQPRLQSQSQLRSPAPTQSLVAVAVALVVAFAFDALDKRDKPRPCPSFLTVAMLGAVL